MRTTLTKCLASTQAAVAAPITVAALIALAGCSAAGSSAPRPEPAIVVAATANMPRPALGAALTATLKHYAATAEDVGAAKVELILGAGGVQSVDLTPMRGRQLEQSDAQTVADRNVAALATVISSAANPEPGNDVLTPLATAARNATPTAPIYVISSMLGTVDPFDLRVIGWGVDPAELAADLAHRQLLPDLSGHRVTFIGVGDTTGRQPALPQPIRTKLGAIVSALCSAAHATSCTITPGDLPDQPPATNASTPPVPVPSFGSLQGHSPAPRQPGRPTPRPPACPTTVVLSADTVPFPPDSARLTPLARHTIAGIAAQLRQGCSGHHLTARGHVAAVPGGSEQVAVALSLARARAVADELVHDRIPPATINSVTGAGDRQPRVTDIRPDGTLDPVAAAKNRRVELSLT